MPTPLWTPPAELVERAVMTRYMRERGFESYADLWQWSVTDLDGFWGSIWDFFGVEGSYEKVLARRDMPGAEWFPGTQVNYAQHLFRGKDPGAVAIVHASELRELGEITWAELHEQTAAMAARLRALGVERGDRVAAYMPNIPETVAAFLATASIGAIWSSCSPDFGPRSVVDRFAQIEPKVLLAVDGYRYNGRDFDRRETVTRIAAETGGEVLMLGYLDGSGWPDAPDHELTFEKVPFEHPLWVLYSSGAGSASSSSQPDGTITVCSTDGIAAAISRTRSRRSKCFPP